MGALTDVNMYFILIALTLVFSIISFEKKQPHYFALTTGMWWLCSIANLGIGVVGGVLTLALTGLYFGLGLFFMLLTFASAIKKLHDATQKRWDVSEV